MSVLFPCVEADGCVWFGLYRVKIGDWMVLGGLRLGKWTRQWHPPTQFGSPSGRSLTTQVSYLE
jgi:hypothetical protein